MRRDEMSGVITNSGNNNSSSINSHHQQQQQHQPMACIKRPQHNMKLANVLNNMLQCGSLTDVTIYCDDGQVNAHKLVLAASSSYFRNLFSRVTNAFHYPIIVLREMHVNDLKTIIQFIYHGEVNVPQNRVDSLMRCANYLEIDGMSSSANSLNAILASSSTSSSSSSIAHHSSLLTSSSSSSGPVSASSNSINHININTSLPLNSKLHAQYPPTANNNCNNTTTSKQTSRGHGSRTNSNNNSNNANSSNPTHSGNLTKPKHTCIICQKNFTHGFTLKRHMKLHSQRPPIFCEICSKSYSCKDSYLRHKKSSGHINHAYHMNLGPER